VAIAYFDSSAFVKLLIEEDGSELSAALWDSCDAAVASRLAYPEVLAALRAAERADMLNPAGQRKAETMWESFWGGTRPVELTEQVAREAGRLANEHALRGPDAVHLASALALDDPEVLFAAWDQRLRDGVLAAGLHLAPAP